MTEVAQIETHRATRALASRAEAELGLVAPELAGARAIRLFHEARAASLEHLIELQGALAETHNRAQAVVEAGDLYSVGLHDFARRLTEELFWRGKTLAGLIERITATRSA